MLGKLFGISFNSVLTKSALHKTALDVCVALLSLSCFVRSSFSANGSSRSLCKGKFYDSAKC